MSDVGRSAWAAGPGRQRDRARWAPRASCPGGAGWPSPRRWRGASAPVVLDNTANLAALGELKCGALQGVSARGLHQGLARGGCGPDPRWRAVPGQRRHRGRDRAPDDRRERADLPVRQPRLPRDLHRRPRPARRRSRARTADDPARHHPPGPRRRPRVSTGARGRGAAPRRGGGRPGQPGQPRGRRPRAASSPRWASIILEPDARRARAVRDPQRGRVASTVRDRSSLAPRTPTCVGAWRSPRPEAAGGRADGGLSDRIVASTP